MSPRQSSHDTRQTLPEWANQAYDLCCNFGFKPKFDHDYPTPDYRRRVQVRQEKHVAPSAEVTKYAEAMRRGDKFPPSVITGDGFLVDGATRVGAAARNKFPSLPMLVLDDDFEGASQDVIQRLYGLGAAFNLRNGKGIDKGEIRKVVERIAQNPAYDATRIAALLGVTENMVRSILAEMKARDRARDLKVDVDALTSGQLRVIGRSEKGMNDAPFAELVALTGDAGLGGKEITALVKGVKEAKADDAALKILAQERAARREQIAQRRATGGKNIPQMSAQLRQHLGFVLKFMNGGAAKAVERNPAFHSEHIRKIDDAVLALQQIGTLQRQVMVEPAE